RYTYYACPRHHDGACPNRRHVREDRLRAAVVARLRGRLFPPPERSGQAPPWLPGLLAMVREEWQRYQDEGPDREAADREELGRLEQQMAGWALTLGNPQLPPTVRDDIEARFAQAVDRKGELLASIAARRGREDHVGRVLDPGAVLAELQRLDEVLAG